MTSTDTPDEFPHPYVAVDVVVLTVLDGTVHVLLIERDSPGVSGWGLPGAYLAIDERIRECRARILTDKCGIDPLPEERYRPLPPRDEPDRDARRRTISLVTWAPARPSELPVGDRPVALLPVVSDGGPVVVAHEGEPVQLAVDHQRMVQDAVDALLAEVDHLHPAEGAVPELVPPSFTARDVTDVLRATMQLGGMKEPDANALRRRLNSVTTGTGELEQLAAGQRHRPAELRVWSR